MKQTPETTALKNRCESSVYNHLKIYDTLNWSTI